MTKFETGKLTVTKFETGKLAVTKGVWDKVQRDSDFCAFLWSRLSKYLSGDWGDTCDEDKKSNDYAVKNGERILAVYTYPKDKTKIWIITEWDRSVTTVLFPSEY